MTDGDWKTIRVPADVYADAKERKEAHGVTWGEYVNPHAWHSVFDAPDDAPGEEPVGDLEPFGGSAPSIDAQIDEDRLREAVSDALDDVTIDVQVDMSEFDAPSAVGEADVKGWVESEVREKVHDKVTRYD